MVFFNTVLSVLPRFTIISLKKRSGCFTVIVFLLSCGRLYSMSLPRDVMGGLRIWLFVVILTCFWFDSMGRYAY